ncbi:MAG: hypothetical protein B7Y58_08550 [Halothiobacillus sp. 35-54-62]|nr:MAG: hypothetical protein B7Y58_08550 [Halothiobacillus sp. 35-54-62]
MTKEVSMTIQVLRKHGLSLRKIADEVGCAVNTVRHHLTGDTPPRYQRTRRKATKLHPFHGYLAERQKAAHPQWIPATVFSHRGSKPCSLPSRFKALVLKNKPPN